MLDLHLFYNGPASLDVAVTAGVDAIVVDCEQGGKRGRQHGYDTEINIWRPRDCEQVRRRTPTLRVVCRIDGFRSVGQAAIDQALEAVSAGADEIILPMVDGLDEVQRLLDALAGRAALGVMIETEGGIAIAAQLDRLPLRRVFIGLNDLMIERGSGNPFQHLYDGTVEMLRSRINTIDFGFGGMTLPELGYPLPCRLLIGELARMRCDFTFLRRSFYRDLASTGLDPAEAVSQMRSAWESACNRSAEAMATDHSEFQATLEKILTGGIQAANMPPSR
jgi:hypothetical protein